MSTRLTLSNRRNHITQKVRIAGQRTLYISVDDDKHPAEIFLRLKGSDCSSELTEKSLESSMGQGVKYGVPVLAWDVQLPGLPQAHASGILDSRELRDSAAGNATLEGRPLVHSKILIIDDDVDSWRLLNTILESHHFRPIWAADGVQAVAAARLHKPQAILLDLGMPGGDGLIILERLKSNRLLSHIPVIVITARDRQEAEEKTQCLGAVAYLQKPIHGDALMETLRTVLATPAVAPEGGAGNVT